MPRDLFSLDGRVALVAGGNDRLGRRIGLGFRKAGAPVAGTGRNPDKNRAVAEELGKAQSAGRLRLKVRDEEAGRRTVGQVLERYGRPDILVKNAGLFRGGPVVEMSHDDWETAIGAHLTGPFLCAKNAARAMIERGAGG